MSAVRVEIIHCAELLRRICCQHGWVYDHDGLELSVVGHDLWVLAEPLANGVELAAERLLDRLTVEGLLR